MESYKKELGEIRTILKANPRGMTVTDIARKININRNSVAKYLDILLISGHAEMVAFGPAKVYFPSRRIPLASMLNFTLNGIIVLDAESKIIEINNNVLALWKLPRDKIIGQNLHHVTIPFFQNHDVQNHVQHAFDGKDSTQEITEYIENEPRHLQLKYVPTAFDDGEPGVTIIIEDITEQKLTQKKLDKIQNQWNIMFHAVEDNISILDTSCTITQANKAYASFFNLSPEECIGKKCYTLLHGTTHNIPSCPCHEALNTKKPVSIELYEPHINKKIRIKASPILNETGEIVSTLHIIQVLPE